MLNLHNTWLLPRNYIVTLVYRETFDTRQRDKSCKIYPPNSEQFFLLTLYFLCFQSLQGSRLFFPFDTSFRRYNSHVGHLMDLFAVRSSVHLLAVLVCYGCAYLFPGDILLLCKIEFCYLGCPFC